MYIIKDKIKFSNLNITCIIILYINFKPFSFFLTKNKIDIIFYFIIVSQNKYNIWNFIKL